MIIGVGNVSIGYLQPDRSDPSAGTLMILTVWKEHQETPFLSVCRGADIDGIDLVMLDADIAGCGVDLLKRGTLDLWRTAILGMLLRRHIRSLASA
jgi:hypothetical protein